MLKAAAYARYSTDHQTENSIAYQMNKIREYCAKNDIVISHEYKDETQSGTNMDRSDFMDMVDAAAGMSLMQLSFMISPVAAAT
ncbi:recombinase family protein [Candidatus Soleaferrea massiliensis]|uniref:recombinase family protein n=1 Tax=Candidatus Soleaferrea massiliensis TaxID=1470354 RepID=UPI0012E0B657|nr:recombinase family protein [Candidatus Soleaferrea massiliensis]